MTMINHLKQFKILTFTKEYYRDTLFLLWTCVKTFFNAIRNKIFGSSSCTQFLPTELVHIQMINV